MRKEGVMPKLLRSFLFVPADRPDRIEKAAAMQTDVVVVELEDGVAPERKAMARNHAGRMLAQLDFNGDVAVRVNRISTLNGVADILALAEWPHKPDMLMIPKVESAGEIQIYDSLLTEIDAQCELIPLVESSRGLQAMTSIVTASSRISAIAFGGADLSAELECLFAWEPLLIHRATLVAAGALAGIPLIDAPFLEIRDNPGLANECKRVRELGYSGKLCTHPSQLETVNRAFSPTQEEVKRAKRILEAVASQGSGAIAVDGRIVDGPLVVAAQHVVDIANRLGMGE